MDAFAVQAFDHVLTITPYTRNLLLQPDLTLFIMTAFGKKRKGNGQAQIFFFTLSSQAAKALACHQFCCTYGVLKVQWDSVLNLREAVRGLFFTGALAYS